MGWGGSLTLEARSSRSGEVNLRIPAAAIAAAMSVLSDRRRPEVLEPFSFC
ncbi:MAG: hypothetical protein ACI8SI_002558 [Congregibacter sp.]|jgi:hypothetical protein